MGKDQRNKHHGLDLRRNAKIKQSRTAPPPLPQPQKRRGRKR